MSITHRMMRKIYFLLFWLIDSFENEGTRSNREIFVNLAQIIKIYYQLYGLKRENPTLTSKRQPPISICLTTRERTLDFYHYSWERTRKCPQFNRFARIQNTMTHISLVILFDNSSFIKLGSMSIADVQNWTSPSSTILLQED